MLRLGGTAELPNAESKLSRTHAHVNSGTPEKVKSAAQKAPKTRKNRPVGRVSGSNKGAGTSCGRDRSGLWVRYGTVDDEPKSVGKRH